MGTLTVYTDIDTLFDTRRGILEHLMKEAGRVQQWSAFESIYRNRTIDLFNKPELGITQSKYKSRFSQRNTDDWIDNEYCYFYPTNVIRGILPIIRMVEYNNCAVIQTDDLDITVNTYPFVLSEGLTESLRQHLSAAIRVKVTINIVTVPFEAQTATYINHFNYVFRYGHLINDELSKWYDDYSSTAIEGAKIIVPDLLAKPLSDDPIYETLNKESVRTLISKISMLQGGKCLLIPFGKGLFDYIT